MDGLGHFGGNSQALEVLMWALATLGRHLIILTGTKQWGSSANYSGFCSNDACA